MEFESGSDTVRRDWLIFLVGILAAAWFFFDYGNHHPLSSGDASLGDLSAMQIGNEKMESFGYQISPDGVITARYQVRSALLDSLQLQANINSFLRDSSNRKIYQPFYWSLDYYISQQAERQDFDFESMGRDPDFTIRLDERGRLLEFRNPTQQQPSTLFHPDAMRSALRMDVQQEHVSLADSLVPHRFSIDLNRTGEPELLNEGVILTRDVMVRMGNYYLEQSGWREVFEEPESIRPVSVGQVNGAELLYVQQNPNVRQRLELTLTLSAGGALASMATAYPSIDGMPTTLQFVLSGLRGFVVVIFFFWLAILLYIRIRLRVIDIRPAILLAVIAGFAFPAFELLSWLHQNFGGPGNPGAVDILMLAVQISLMAAFISLAYFVVVITGDSITRQNWVSKIRTLDLVRIGHYMNRPTGVALIHAVSFGFILAAIWSALQWVFPVSYLTVPDAFVADQTYLAPLTHLGHHLLLCFFIIQIIYLILIGQVSSYSKSGFVTVTASVLVFGLMAPEAVSAGPAGVEIVFSGAIGLILGLIYHYRDFLTTFLTFFIFTVLITTSQGWLVINSPDASVFYPAAGILFVFLIVGYLGITRGKSVRELPKYVPDYIEELAQEERIKQELQIARKVQQSFLPISKPELPGLDLGAVCIPAYETGGDYYDFIQIDRDRYAITIGDVSGKGFQAAFYMTFIKGVLHALCRDLKSTSSVLVSANELLFENVRRGTFISLIFGVIDLKNGLFTFSRAGHNPLLHYQKNEDRLRVIRPDGLALGMTRDEAFKNNLYEESLQLEKGDLLVLFTDGIVEAVSADRQFYGDKRLHRLLKHHHEKSSEEIVSHIIQDVQEFAQEAKQHDDMTLLVIKRSP
ncbi:MAG: PP2C family protein-serine/threonine phosphatase [Balneolaceae bacterium]